jgi:hypothetical protein
MIDHVDGCKTNNRITNLREATNQQNLRNMARLRSDNTSGFRGVHWAKKRQKWVAAICVDGRSKFLGHYPTRQAAHEAYSLAATELFGEFARAAGEPASTERAAMTLR